MNRTDNLVKVLEKLMNIVESRRINTKVIDLFPGFKRGGRDGRISASAFALTLADYCITKKEAFLVFDYLDSNQKGFISYQQFATLLKKFIKAFKNGDNMEMLFQKDEVFPSWLVDRSDFQKVFPRFATTDEKHKDMTVLKKAFSTSIYCRSHEQLRMMAKWIQNQPGLERLGSKRAWKLAQVLEYTTLPNGKVLFNQGDPGDCFYVVFSGEVAIVVDGQQVAIFGPGKTFGEQALENRSPRAATVRAVGFCEFLKLTAEDYSKIMVNERKQKLKETAEFLKRIWKGGRYKDTPKAKIVWLAQILHREKFSTNEVIFDQGSEPSVFYIVLCGSAELRKVVQVEAKNSWPVGKRAEDKVTRVLSTEKLVHLKDMRVGDHFGEDTLFDFTGRQYRAVATQDDTEVLIINRRHIKDFLTEEEQCMIHKESKYMYASSEHVRGLYESDHKHRKQLQQWILSVLGPSYKKKAMDNTNGQFSDLPANDFSMSPNRAIGKDETIYHSTYGTPDQVEKLQRNSININKTDKEDKRKDMDDSLVNPLFSPAKYKIASPKMLYESKLGKEQDQFGKRLPTPPDRKQHGILLHSSSMPEQTLKDFSKSPRKNIRSRNVSSLDGSVDNLFPTLSSTHMSNRKHSETSPTSKPIHSSKRPTSAFGSFGNEVTNPNKSKEIQVHRPTLTIHLNSDRVSSRFMAPLSSTEIAQQSIRTTVFKPVSSHDLRPPSIQTRSKVYLCSPTSKEGHGFLSQERTSPPHLSLRHGKITSPNRSLKASPTKQTKEAFSFQPDSFEDEPPNSFPTIFV